MKIFNHILKLGVILPILMVACNKPVDNLLPKSESQNDTSDVIQDNPKVLYLVVDGLRGQAVEDLEPTNITTLQRYAITTNYSISSSAGIKEIGWTDLLTGVDSSKHKVKSADMTDNNLSSYPTIFTRLKSLNNNLQFSSYVRSTQLNDILLKDVDNRNVLNSDAAVADGIVKELSTTTSSIVFGQFNSIDSSGNASGFESTSDGYIRSIQNVDNYIGDIMDALRARPSYSKENWLVVFASSKGGLIPYTPTLGMDSADYANPLTNTCVYFYNPKFVAKNYLAPDLVPFSAQAPQYTYSSSNTFRAATVASTQTAADIYDITASNEMTISFKLKVLAFGTLNPGIVLKTKTSANSGNGWWFAHNGSNGSIRFVVKGSATKTLTSDASYHKVGEWHSYTGKVYFAGGKRWIKLYEDGICRKNDSLEVTGSDATAVTSSVYYPLSIGIKAPDGSSYTNGTTTQIVADLKIYNVALSDAVIATEACKIGVANTDTSHLIGYWPCTEGSGTTLKDYSSKKKDLIFTGTGGTWASFNDQSNYICPTPDKSYFNANPKGIDAPIQILNWLNYTVLPSWNLTGRYWTPYLSNLK